eukprot:UN07233
MAFVQKEHKKKVVEFGNDYLFRKTNIVVIRNKIGSYFRVKPGNEEAVDGAGGKGGESQWKAEPSDGGKKVTFQSVKTGKFLRLTQNGIDAAGDGDKFCVFRVHHMNNVIKLESCDFKAHYVGCVAKNSAMVGGGGMYCDINVYSQN